MRKITVLFVFVGIVFSFQSFAGNGDLFSYDKGKVDSQLSDLKALETMVLQDASITYEGLLEANNPLVEGLNTNSSMMMSSMSSSPILPPFWWGCLLGPVGVIAVYILDDTPAHTKSAFWGCLISTLVYGFSTFGYYGIWAGVR